jgi:hypothetical protein
LKSFVGPVFCAQVKRIKVTVSVFLLVLWVPFTSHSLLEQMEWIHHEDVHSEAGSRGAEHHDAADGLCRIESNDCQLPNIDFQRSSYGGLLELQFVGTPNAQFLIFAAGLAPPPTGSPELIHVWQFVFRTALLPRAPSLLC